MNILIILLIILILIETYILLNKTNIYYIDKFIIIFSIIIQILGLICLLIKKNWMIEFWF